MVATIAAAMSWGRHVIRCKPHTPAGVVLSSVDDRVLAGGGAAGVMFTIVTMVTDGTWLGWSWTAIILDGAASAANWSPVLGWIILLPLFLFDILLPLVVMMAFPTPMLAMSMTLADMRNDRLGRPTVTVPAIAVISFVLGVTPAISVCVAVFIAVAALAVDRGTPIPDVVSSLPDRLRPGGMKPSDESANAPQSWELITPAARFRAARMSAVVLVALMTFLITASAWLLLMASWGSPDGR
jgi:hypothetical protein